MSKTKSKRLRGKVQKVLKPIVPCEPEKAQISVDEADELYREIRVENVLTDENGDKVRLKLGSEVDVVLEADTDATTKQPDPLKVFAARYNGCRMLRKAALSIPQEVPALRNRPPSQPCQTVP